MSFLGDSGNRGMAICHSSGSEETKTYSPRFGFGVRGNFGEFFYFRFEVNLKFLFIEKNFFRKVQENELNCQNSCFSGTLREYWQVTGAGTGCSIVITGERGG